MGILSPLSDESARDTELSLEAHTLQHRRRTILALKAYLLWLKAQRHPEAELIAAQIARLEIVKEPELIHSR